ncbi:MAG: hydroxymethylglutaryl-CoA lyase [Myxococcota bacterium]|nr:hydroxymethylglutaryl-CoA lyase [Myxococcota bacterium]
MNLTVYEVGPRDGLQNEKTPIATEDKIDLVEALWKVGVRRMEATSFVSPRAIPQLADAPEVYRASTAHEGLQSHALVINEKGWHRAAAAGVQAVAIVVVVSETLCARNNRMTVEQSVETALRLIELSREAGIFARVYVAPAWVCPYDGPVPIDHVLRITERLAHADELAVADTIGHAHPAEVGRLFEALANVAPLDRIAAHFHDTQGLGLANAYAAIQAGVRTLDSSVGGLGGCPFARGAAGNLATEDLVLMAHKMGLNTGIDLDGLWDVVSMAENLVGHPIGGRSTGWWSSPSRIGACS